MSEFARAGDGVEAPHALTVIYVIGVEKTEDAVFAARDPDQNFVFHYQRRVRRGVTELVVGHLGIPQDAPRLTVQRYGVRVHGWEEQFIAQNGQPAIHL